MIRTHMCMHTQDQQKLVQPGNNVHTTSARRTMQLWAKGKIEHFHFGTSKVYNQPSGRMMEVNIELMKSMRPYIYWSYIAHYTTAFSRGYHFTPRFWN